MNVSLPSPRHLLKTLEAVERAHPYSESAPLIMEGRVVDDSAALWNRLLSASREKLEAILSSLSRLELRLLAVSAPSRMDDHRCRPILVKLYLARRERSLGSLLWESFLLQPGEPDLRLVAKEVASFGDCVPLWRRMATATSPTEEAASHFLRQRSSFESWLADDSVRLSRYGRFARLVQRALLSPPSLRQTDVLVPHETLDEWASTAIDAGERVAWQRSYLETTYGHTREPDHAVLGRIVDQHGTPDGRRKFWDDMPPAIVADVESWLKNRDLTRLLGEGERVRFWRRFLPQMTSSSATRDRQVVFVVFDKFFAAQFVNSGAATYFFPKNMLLGFRRETAARVYQLVLRNQHKRLGRYTHQGSSWEFAAEAEVRLAIQRAASL